MAIEAQLYSENLGFALGGPQEVLMDKACGFNNLCFIPQQQKQQQQSVQFGQFQNLSHHKNLNILLDNTDTSPFISKNNIKDQQFTAFPQSFSAQIEKQRMEIDRFISLQNERLRLTLQEQRKHQTALFMKKYESKTLILLNQREEEITKATNRTMELEDCLKRMEIENQTWQKVAKENEAMVASLTSTIERLKETVSLSANAAEDAESCCQNIEEGNGDHHFTKKMVCRCCNSRNSCVIMLPCRHLCSCKDCEAFLDSCPVCAMVKKASIEALI